VAYFSVAVAIYLCHDDVVARSLSLSFQPIRLLHFSNLQPLFRSTPLSPVSQTEAELQSLLPKGTDGAFHRS
jgi:hypothetical protein